MEFAELLLSPVIWVMDQVVWLIHKLFGSYGIAIIGLSIMARLALAPIGRIAARAEAKEQAVQAAMSADIANAKKTLKGREQFEAIDRIYQAHGYHPIKGVVALLPIALQIPFLLSALFLLTDHPSIMGERFLFIRDLAEPDGLLPLGSLHINILPILLTGIAVYESTIRPAMTRPARVRFLIVSAVIAALIYPLPAAVCLYWLTSNLWSLGSTMLKNRGPSAAPAAL